MKFNCTLINGSYAIRFTLNGTRKTLFPGTQDELIAQKVLKQMAYEWEQGDFDLTLERYKLKNKQQHSKQQSEQILISVWSIWQQYYEYKSPNLKAKTLEEYSYHNKILSRLPSIKATPINAIKIRQELLKATSTNVAKKILMHLNGAFKLAIKNAQINSNPFEGESQTLTYSWENPDDSPSNPFTLKEQELIISEFRNHNQGMKGISYSHYADFVEFLFLTGCRPSEAIGLQWKNVSNDFSSITFAGSIVQVNGCSVRAEKSKNNKTRIFPCNKQLKTLLKRIKPTKANSEALVFPAPKGGPIRYNNFSRRAWNVIVDPIKSNTTPYSCRDTFITQQCASGINTAIIAKWVDNSVKMIEKRYLGSTDETVLPS